ncbi:MAG: deoxyribonuclease V [Planctomycetes bacterium]|nr:deoxyribonuclease V [Planctomycetota bacterium]
MGAPSPSRWSPTPTDARAVQERLRGRVETSRRVGRIELVAGVDCSARDGRVRAAIVVVALDGLVVVEEVAAERVSTFPYVPGLLSFRELPAIEAAWAKLKRMPDVLLVDGHGLAHPRRIGIASHVGVVLDRPSIGCGKSLLVGEHAKLRLARGAHVPLIDRGETVGVALRTRARVAPLYVSIGHRVDLELALELVTATVTRYRLPEPVRRADALAGEWRTDR